jgi:ribose 5-phosphate isomerase A
VIPLGTADLPIPLYVDGADEVDLYGRAIKGGGGAHWREKLVAGASQMWVCIVDDSKLVDRLGTHSPVPLEVEFSDLDSVEASVRDLGGRSVLREGALTDSGNPILDVHDLDLMDPHAMELDLETIPGVLASGIFAARRADLIVVGREDGSSYTLEPKPL